MGGGSDCPLDRAEISVLGGAWTYRTWRDTGRAATGRGGDCADTWGLATFRATGAKLELLELLSRMAEVYRKGGQLEEGLTVLAETLAMVVL